MHQYSTGRFYTLLVIGTALFDQPPWKNLIVNGLILAKYDFDDLSSIRGLLISSTIHTRSFCKNMAEMARK